MLIKAALEQIRIIRIQDYGEVVPVATPAGGIPVQRGLMPTMESGMVLRFHLYAPTGWEVIGVNQGWLQQVIDGGSHPLIDPQHPVIAFPPEMDLSRRRELGEGPVIELTSPLPDRATSQLQSVSARFDVTVGQRKSYRFEDVRQHVGQLLVGAQPSPVVTLKLLEVSDDLVALVGLGQIECIGRIDVEDAAGQMILPYASEVQDADPKEPGGPPEKLWRLSFTALPRVIGIRVEVFTDLRRGTIPIMLPAVPLP
ncbi:MAG: hypothetical protein M1457_03410 [bacterium]|nr:hypothetical protein [bacterium]